MIKHSFDTETRGLGWYNADEHAFLTTWSDTRGNDHLAHQDDARAMAAFKSDMQASDVIVAHNLPFDVHQVRESENGFDMLKLGKKLVDTSQLARVAVPERRFAEGDENGFTLDALSKTYLPAGDQKMSLDERAKELGIKLKEKGGYYKLWQEDPALVEEYARRDTRSTIEVLPPLASQLDDGTRQVWELERDVQPHLIRAEARGVLVDQAKVEPLKEAYTARRDQAYADVEAVLPGALGDPDDPEQKDKPEAMREALLAHGVPLHRTSPKTGELTVSAPALSEFKHDFPVIESIFEYRKASKFLSTYIDPMLGRDVVHTSFNQQGAWTGRMSSSRPNLQNIPVRGEGSSELREMFVPRPGHVFVVSDYDSIELRILAYLMNVPEFIERVEAGVQVFQELAAVLWPHLGTSPDDFAKGTPLQQKRSDAKNGTYAICYGVGAAKLSDMLGLPPGPPLGPNAWKVKRGYAAPTDPSYPEGTRIIKLVKSWLPGYWKLMSTRPNDLGRVIAKVRATGHINTIMRRRQPISADKEYVALSGYIQGSAADIFKQGVINVAEAVAHLGALPVMFVHDEIVTECPIEHAEEALRLQDEAMRSAYDLRPRLSVEGTIAHHSYAEGK